MTDAKTPATAPHGRFRRTVDRIIRFETTVLLTLFYFTVFGATALLLRLFGKELLPPFDPDRETYWHRHPSERPTLDTLKRQF